MTLQSLGVPIMVLLRDPSRSYYRRALFISFLLSLWALSMLLFITWRQLPPLGYALQYTSYTKPDCKARTYKWHDNIFSMENFSAIQNNEAPPVYGHQKVNDSSTLADTPFSHRHVSDFRQGERTNFLSYGQ